MSDDSGQPAAGAGAPEGDGQPTVGGGGGAGEKPAILQESVFVVEESWLYKLARTLSIWLNKLFFSSLVLLAVWLAIGDPQCVETVNVATAPNGTSYDDGIKEQCSVFLSDTARFLGGAAIISFILSIAFGGLGLIVGKNIFETTRTEDEAGAEEAVDGGSSGHDGRR